MIRAHASSARTSPSTSSRALPRPVGVLVAHHDGDDADARRALDHGADRRAAGHRPDRPGHPQGALAWPIHSKGRSCGPPRRGGRSPTSSTAARSSRDPPSPVRRRRPSPWSSPSGRHGAAVGNLSAAAAGVNDFDKAAGQRAIGGPSASGETAWSSLTVSGAPQSSGSCTGFSSALDTYAVVRVAMSMDGTPPTIWVDGVMLTTSATNPTTTGLLTVDRILLGASWYDGGPKDGQQFRLGAFLAHAGRLSSADHNAIRTWAAETIGTPTV